MVHRDICGPISPPTTGGNKYFLLLVNDFNIIMWVYFREQKLTMAMSIFNEMNMSSKLCGEAVRHSIYVLNCFPTRVIVCKTPYGAWSGKVPNLVNLKFFGCISHIKYLLCI